MFIPPSRQPYDPRYQLRTAGTFYCLLTGIDEIGPDKNYDSTKNRLVFEFTVVDRKFPHLHGQKGVTIVTASVFKNKKTGQESNLVKLARSMGVVDPLKGFDPDMLLDKYYMVCFELHDGKAFAKTVMPAPGPGDKGHPEVHTIRPNEREQEPEADNPTPF